jgi:phage portal protein BeeE
LFGLISKKTAEKKVKAITSELTHAKALLKQVARFDLGANTIVWSGGDDNKRIKDGYQANHLVYSIINKLKNHVLRPEWGVYRVKDAKKHKDYLRYKSSLKTVYGKGFQQMVEMKESSLERVQHDNWDKLFIYPNHTQTWGELTVDELIFFMITGNALTGSIRLQNGLNAKKPQQLFTIPTNLVTVKSDGFFPAAAAEYVLQLGKQIPFKREDVIHFRFASVDYGINGNQLWGQSPLQAAANILTESNKAGEANVKAFNNLGAGQAVFIDEPTVSFAERDAAKNQMKESWSNEWTGVENNRATKYSSLKLGSVPLGLSPVDLDIISAKGVLRDDMCSVFDFPPVLLSPDNSAYNNYRTAIKAAIQGPVLAFLQQKRDAYNRMNTIFWGGKAGEIIDFDVACFTELAEEETEKLKALNMRPAKLREYYQYGSGEIPEGVTDEDLNTWIMPNNLTANGELFDAAGGDIKINNDY